MKANQVMTRDVVCVSTYMGIASAFDLMKREGVRHLPVVEGGKLIGILSDRDLLLRAHLRPDQSLAFDESVVANAMTLAPVTCSPGATVAQIAGLMLEHTIDSIPIVGVDGRLTGLVTSSDLLGLLCEPEKDSKVLPFDFLLRLHEVGSVPAA